MAEWNAALEWAQFARSDMDTAIHLFNTMRPMPLEIICYHCQQAAEKMLKGILIAKGQEIQRTHDLGLLAEQCQTFTEVPDEYLEMCDELTPYGVKVRYPQELLIEERHATKAVEQAKKLCDWADAIIQN